MAQAFFGISTLAIIILIVIWNYLMKNSYILNRLEIKNSRDLLLNSIDDQKADKLVNDAIIDYPGIKSYLESMKRVIIQARYPFTGLIFGMATTYSVYPAVTQRGTSQCASLSSQELIDLNQNQKYVQYYYCKFIGTEIYPLIYCFLSSHIASFIGRYLVSIYRPIKIHQTKKLMLFLVLRLIPALLLLFTRRSNYYPSGPFLKLLSYDVSAWIINFIHILFGGYVQVLCYNFIPGKIEKLEDKHLGGDLIVYGCAIGVSLGSLFSFLTVIFIS